MESESQLDKNLRKLISAVHPVQSQPEVKRKLLNKLVRVVETRKQTADRRHAIWRNVWRHPVLYAGMSAAAVLLIAFLLPHIERRAPNTLPTASMRNCSKSVRTLAEDGAVIKMLKEIKSPNQFDLSVKPLGLDVKPPRPCGWDIRPRVYPEEICL